MPEEIITQGLPHKKLAPVIEKLKKKVFKNKVVKDLLKKYDIDEEELAFVPVCFAKIPVSARTDHGVIYLNIDLIDDRDFLDKEDHYLPHEFTHYCQQTTGSKPTPSAEPEKYLDSPVEQEGFRNQSKYISDTQGEEEAKDYIEKVLDHHMGDDADDKKREKREDKLLAIARRFGIDLEDFSE